MQVEIASRTWPTVLLCGETYNLQTKLDNFCTGKYTVDTR